MASKIPIDSQKLADLCRRHHIRWLALFGSVLRNDFGPLSDVDVLAEFAPDHVPGLDFFLIEEELSRLLGRRVDLNTPGFLGPELVHSSAGRGRGAICRGMTAGLPCATALPLTLT
jgi:predicted nucleotidyltransferase